MATQPPDEGAAAPAWDRDPFDEDAAVRANTPRSLSPRGAADEGHNEFELNTAATLATHALTETDWSTAPDELRVREAIRRIIELDADTDTVARDLALAPSSVAKWRQKYTSFVAEQAGLNQSPDWNWKTDWQGDVVLPDEWKERFVENWQHLLDEAHATAADFVQDPLEVFLTQSIFTSWLFREGKLDRHVIFGLACGVTFLILAVTWYSSRTDERVAAMPQVTATLSPDELNKREIDQGLSVAKAYFAADGWEKKKAFIREPDRVAPVMQRWFERYPTGPIVNAEFLLGEVEGDVVRLLATLPDDRPAEMMALVKENGVYLLDWESTSAFKQQIWAELSEKRPTEPFELECVAEPFDYWNYSFSDQQKWHAFRLTYPGVERDFVGYVERLTAVGNEIDAQLAFSEWVGVTLIVSFAPGNVHQGYPQLRIHDMLGKAWLKGTAKDVPKAVDLITTMASPPARPQPKPAQSASAALDRVKDSPTLAAQAPRDPATKFPSIESTEPPPVKVTPQPAVPRTVIHHRPPLLSRPL